MNRNTYDSKLLECIKDFKCTLKIDYKYYKNLAKMMEKEAKKLIELEKNLAKHINRAANNG